MSAEDAGGGHARAYEALYVETWTTLARLRAAPPTADWLVPESTPILAFGAWQTARVVTAALNPSEDEFLTPERPRRPLPPDARRLLHWPADGQLTLARLREARRRAEAYFVAGQAYTRWFGRYVGLLEALDAPFAGGRACQTNYGSPFTTRVGWGAVPPRIRAALAADGAALWRRLLDLLPCLEIVVGQGAGWRTVPALFGFTPDAWTPIPTPLDAKGGRAAGARPHLLHRVVTIAGRPVDLFWWRPNRGGPLTWLSRTDAALLGRVIRERRAG